MSMRGVCHTLAAILLCLVLSSCGARQRIIPRSTMADIYADMLLADQWLADHNYERPVADTSLFYDPIFASYGYTFEDYDRSVKHYLKDPERFSKVFREASRRLKRKGKVYERKKEQIASILEFNAQIKGYKARDFGSDSLLWRPPVTDSLVLDSLRRDSLRRDSLRRRAFVLDSLQRDSLFRDSVDRVNFRRDSILRARRARNISRNQE